jgi:hypothetical protein
LTSGRFCWLPAKKKARHPATRYTEPEPDLRLLLHKLKLTLSAQPSPKITATAARQTQPA